MEQYRMSQYRMSCDIFSYDGEDIEIRFKKDESTPNQGRMALGRLTWFFRDDQALRLKEALDAYVANMTVAAVAHE